MKKYTNSGARMFSDSVWNLYSELSKKFGNDKAWEFILAFYEGAGRE